MNEQEIINEFCKLYYDQKEKTWKNTYWMGIELQKIPLDLWIYQEILYEIRPDLIIETGTFVGGSAYYLAHLCDILGNGKIITIDNNSYNDGSEKKRPFHSRIEYLLGSSIDSTIIDYIKTKITPNMKVLVILDSDHSKKHVLHEMKLYGQFVTTNSYLIVEDSSVNGHPLYPEHGPGPMEAIDEFLLEDGNFIIDSSREKFMLTLNPKGYLKRI